MNTKQLLEKIRDLMAECTDSEQVMFSALVTESDGWRMRLDEIEDEDGD